MLAYFQTMDRASRYSLAGVGLGLFAPLGWFALRLVFFGQSGMDLWAALSNSNFQPAEHLTIILYMGVGTAAVLGTFGYLIGEATEAIQERARSLDELNQTIAQQKANYEQRFLLLNANLKSFHVSNARIQSSIDSQQVVTLTADTLHDILGYDRVNILLVNSDRTRLEFAASRCGEKVLPTVSLPLDERAGAIYQSIRDNRALLVRDIEQEPIAYRLQPPCDAISQLRSKSFILAPITIDHQAIGLVAIDNKHSRNPIDETDVDTLRLFTDQMAAALNRIRLVQGVEALVNEMNGTFSQVAHYRSRFAGMVHSLKNGSVATASTIVRIADSAEIIRTVVDETSSATTEISAAIDEVTANFEKLQEFMEESIATMTEITATARHVEENASRSLEMSETVRDHAESGVQAVQSAFQGLSDISSSVDSTRQVIEELSIKGREIDRIIDVIAEINQKTNLLSLNAAIIAAQAGEHGLSFAVVADEIRSLSRETAKSAEAIGGLVNEIQQRTELAVRHIGETRHQVDRDITLSHTTEQALQRILDSAVAAMRMALEIRQSTTEQVSGSQSVSRSIEELGDMAGHLLHASREQAQGIQRIMRSIVSIKTMSEEMVAATAQQNQATRRIDQEVDQVSDMATHIFDDLAARQNESYRVIERLEAVKRAGSGGQADR